ncbi:hypothetical protein PGTUg99_019925, partial [Puccinia graminis f. sp. tritici]
PPPPPPCRCPAPRQAPLLSQSLANRPSSEFHYQSLCLLGRARQPHQPRKSLCNWAAAGGCASFLGRWFTDGSTDYSNGTVYRPPPRTSEAKLPTPRAALLGRVTQQARQE